ncbi:uncharacterized protein LOC124876659 [Girardinichthys multiradiatus]|uniref:uncharacterized protein LOC124876659 n=1 Tax=Girardinichthys multiradiatus TaxID=208333 RepID=UPI001FAC9DDE|nr:uncharacterized protein LOC124876659 [Girardinichthys multiradiatus]
MLLVQFTCITIWCVHTEHGFCDRSGQFTCYPYIEARSGAERRGAEGEAGAMDELKTLNKYSCDFISQKIPIFSEDVCRRKWKGLRDTYLKERRKELEKRGSGAAAGAGKKWRFSGVLSFLDPFVAPRPIPSNMGQVEEMAEDLPAPPPEEDTSETEDTNGDDTEWRSTQSEAPAASSVSDSAPSSSAAAQPPVGRRRRTVQPWRSHLRWNGRF